mmetsp:Transcript_28727/g.112040  ORF Transcript_28727/g.112040 Transcript_28727/m.112040 type:complete len:567 (-) Transcript_28727:1380-3080(-)|eukprot:CAMPEP_0113963364 /NCGR_PEP_ID=MMETSP0011_2-20120614/6470_1 /TAXON_ID=101924 /ORGANISM="Rhodosorus marinus" /LENGTH=566 /DNA_ID=CAMNT_0000975401 /DNA_START=262 /DNA_END=1962 /DNA_ORIENTATION=+ /assembly_acc=CAM_ASM_000156
MDDLFLIDDSGEDAVFVGNGSGGVLAKLPDGGESNIGVGDHVLLRADKGFAPSVAVVVKIAEKIGLKKDDPEMSDMYVTVKWYYHLHDLRSRVADLIVPAKGEVFETDEVEVFIADVILGKCRVLSFADFLRKDNKDRDLYFFCRYHYDRQNWELTPSAIDFSIKRRVAKKSGKGRGKDRPSDEWNPLDYGDLDVNADHSEESDSSPVRKRRRRNAYQFTLPSVKPTKLLGREDETEKVRAFVLTVLREGESGSRCLYISGVPGTGKTATVMGVLNELSEQHKGDLRVAEINGMAMLDAHSVYSMVYAAIGGRRGLAPLHDASSLDRTFSRGRKGRPLAILVLDEMDTLVSRRQKVLYDLFEWTTKENSRMAIIGIANTMDLPERVLPRISSRLGLNRIIFAPYTSAQITTILKESLLPTIFGDGASKLFEDQALDLCSRKTAAVSGDLRRALEMCKLAATLAKGQKVDLHHVAEASVKMSSSPMHQFLKNNSMDEKAVMNTAATIVRDYGSEVLIERLLSGVKVDHGVKYSEARQAMLSLISMNILTRTGPTTVALNISLADGLS